MTEVERAQDRLFGPNGLGCRDIKLFLAPGNHTAEEIAGAVNKMLDCLESGNYTEINSIENET
jgi:hypothetical protein